MSAFWVLGLGASLGYVVFKQQKIASRLEQATREYDNGSMPADNPGANVSEIRGTLSAPCVDGVFQEKLPVGDQSKVLKMEKDAERAVQQYDQGAGVAPPVIQGVWLDGVSF